MSEYYKDSHRYDDILECPHHTSGKHTPMSLYQRAAQFAPFAALTGHEECMEETARLTTERMTLDESEIERINQKIQELAQHLEDKWMVEITYFKPDSHKQGGAYLTDVGTIRKINLLEKNLVMDSGIVISMEQIVRIEKS